MVSNIPNIKRTLHRGLALTQKESYDLYDYIQTLEEQQPFINKPCISEGVCREDRIQVLAKIRAEIEKLEYLNIEDGSGGYDKYIEQYEVLKILDKAESEV